VVNLLVVLVLIWLFALFVGSKGKMSVVDWDREAVPQRAAGVAMGRGNVPMRRQSSIGGYNELDLDMIKQCLHQNILHCESHKIRNIDFNLRLADFDPKLAFA
jgi:hypothetical protein